MTPSTGGANVSCSQQVDPDTDFTDVVFTDPEGTTEITGRVDGVSPLDENLVIVEGAVETITGLQSDGVWSNPDAENFDFRGKKPDDSPSTKVAGKGTERTPTFRTSDGAIWQKTQVTPHGGGTWKRWPNRRSFDRGDRPMAVRQDGSVSPRRTPR